MSILNILHHPDERLRKIAEPVKIFDTKIKRIVHDMFETMYEKKGIGLAATQVNIHQRIIVIDISETYSEKMVFINPIILKIYGVIKIEEGCLSIPNEKAFIPRAKWIKIQASDINGKQFEIETNNILSVCIQHEIDHLNGKLFIDYLSLLKRQRIKHKIKNLNLSKFKF
ncbi:Peptide deformylase [Candidatus Arsenophonus lipoptenae]|uniref:Peptide deformylase n=1 Tax=Candidatus Arsenophonus lipoptenae TaxID=634113 RepID=A0A0X9VVM0_9GAMM|nr:peptide deformylase [Candidatus Arsenophonus lipoptenae]AMA65043.1 Peptide deformylase [Candidatus Arsenophonus lipoptenae]